MRRIKIKPVSIQVHPNFYKKMEEMRKNYKKNNLSLSQIELTNLIASRIKIPQINLLGVKNVKKQKRKCI